MAAAVAVLGAGSIRAAGSTDDPTNCDVAMRTVQEVRAFWDVADDRRLSAAQVAAADVALETSAEVADRCGAAGSEGAAPTTEPTAAGPREAASGEALWHADADADVDDRTATRFWTKEVASGDMSRLAIADDPTGQFGKVYLARLTPSEIEGGSKRAEFSQALLGDGETRLRLADEDAPDGSLRNLWFGWRSLFGTDLVADTDHRNDGNFMQLKGDSACGGPGVGMSIKYGRLTLRSEQYLTATDGVAWRGPLMSSVLDGRWHDFVLHVNFAKDDTGYLEVWLNGQPQTMVNGSTRIYFPTICPNDTYLYPKLGVYGMDTTVGVGPQHWFESPRLGTSYEAVVPR